MWVKKCVEMREMLFKNTNQTPPQDFLPFFFSFFFSFFSETQKKIKIKIKNLDDKLKQRTKNLHSFLQGMYKSAKNGIKIKKNNAVNRINLQR